MTDSMAYPVVLLVEDSLDDELLALRIFDKYRIANDVVVARSAAEALEYSQGVAPGKAGLRRIKPQMVLIDTTLPDSDPDAFVEKLRTMELMGKVPVILMANSKEDEEKIKALNLENAFCFCKPIGFFKLLEAMQKLGVYWLIFSDTPPREGT